MRVSARVFAGVGLAMIAGPMSVSGGSYALVTFCDETIGCVAGTLHSNPAVSVTAFGITHPLGYDGSPGVLQVPVCVSDDHPELIAPTQRAIATWNNLTPTVENCIGCMVWEAGDNPSTGTYHAESTIVHELGHCAMGLGHPNRLWDVAGDGFYEETSFSKSNRAGHPGGINPGPDGIPGSFDDVQVGIDDSPIDSTSWFRKVDNNPVVIDDLVIDSQSYSRRVHVNLPADHSFAANGNRRVAESLGFPFTQAIMYSRGVRGQVDSGLTADEVNMVRMGMTGVDMLAGTADDYTVQLSYVTPCSAHPTAARVTMTPLGAEVLGQCSGVAIDHSFPQNPVNAQHYSLVELVSTFPPFLRLNETLPWDFGPPLSPVVFRDGFESGDFSAWDDAVPGSATGAGG